MLVRHGNDLPCAVRQSIVFAFANVNHIGVGVYGVRYMYIMFLTSMHVSTAWFMYSSSAVVSMRVACIPHPPRVAFRT